MLRALIELCRLSNLPTVWTNVIAARLLSGQIDFSAELGWLLLGASLVYSAGMMLNDACDAGWDRQNRPERPIPSGRISLGTVWALGGAGLIGGAALMIGPGHANAEFTLLLVLAVLAYDWYHKPWTGSVVIMGGCRTLLYVAAGASMIGKVSPHVWAGGLALGAYIIGLTLMARGEATGSMSMVRRSLVTLLTVLPALAALMHYSTSTMTVVLSVMQIIFVGFIASRMRAGGPAIGQGVGWLLAGIPLVDAMAVAHHRPTIAACFVLLVPMLRWWQRFVAAT